MDDELIANPGSAIGEAIGALIEVEVNRLLRPIAEEYGCLYITFGPPNLHTGLPRKLILTDNAHNDFNIDSVIANERMQPLVLIESKYIRYKKHNCDKGSWICKERDKAHRALRQWKQLENTQYEEIAQKLLSDIEPALRSGMKETLDTAAPREVREVEVTIETNLGEFRHYTFESVAAAITFLEDFDEEEFLNNEDGPSMWLKQ